MNEIKEIKIPKGVDRIAVKQHDDKVVIEFIPKKPKLKEGDLAIFWGDNNLNPTIRLYHVKSHNGHSDNFGTIWGNAVKWDGTKEQFEKVLRGEI